MKDNQLQLQLASPSPQATERQVWRPPPLLLDQDAVIHAHLLSRIDEVTPLMVNLESMTLLNSTRSLAVRALAAVYFGKTHGDKRIFDLGSREYVKALNRVQLDLASSTAVLEWDTLASVICLCMFENIVFTDKTGWFKHYEGITQLVGSAMHHDIQLHTKPLIEGQTERTLETPDCLGKGTPQTVPVRDSMSRFSQIEPSLTGIDTVRTDKQKALLSRTSRVADRPMVVECIQNS